MDVAKVSGLNRARREASFQTSVVTANAQPAADVERDVSEVARSSRGAAHDYAIDQRCGSDACTESEQEHIAPPTSCAPKHFADQGGACVVVGTERQVIHTGQFAQQMSFQKIQIAR